MGFKLHVECPHCGSSDAASAIPNADVEGMMKCFSCDTAWVDDEYKQPTNYNRKSKPMDLLSIESCDLNKRKIPEAITKKYRYGTAVDNNGNLCQVANYYNKEKELVAQKLRYPDKTFKFIGETKEALLYGQTLWGNGKKLVITEGEIDALSVSTAFDGKYPVVSIKGGSTSAKREISAQLEWINEFEEIYFWFDNDEPGRKALEECVNLVPANKVKIIRHADYKDANEVLVYTGKSGILNCFYNAEKYKPDDIVSPDDLLDTIAEPIKVGFDYYYSGLSKALYGRRFGEVITVGAGVSIGKTDFIMSQMAFDLQQGWKVATFMLEQSTKETLLRTAGKVDGIHYHLPDAEFDKDKLKETVHSFQGNLFMFDNFGSNDWETIKDKIRYMFHNYGCRIFYIDNLTALNAHATDERRNLDALMAEVAGLAQELDVWVMLVSHLNPPKSGPTHEAGGKTEQAQFTGSRAIMRWSYTMLGIERNTLHEDPDERNKGLVRILKDRFSGSATGNTVGFYYDKDSGICHELDEVFEITPTEGADDSDF